MAFLPALLNDFVALFFPNYCFTCRETLVHGERYICTFCRVKLPKTNSHFNKENHLLNRYKGFIPLVHFLPYLKFQKGGKVQKIMGHLKYRDCPEIGAMLGEWYGNDLLENGFSDAFDLIIPVPLHQSKLLKRGYNQSDFFAKGLSAGLLVPWSDGALVRTTKNFTQTKKGRIERFENVSGIFMVKDAEAIKGKRILLVDDVITTGATLFACAAPLINAECKNISIATLAIAQ